MKAWQKISFVLIALVLCLGLLGMNQLGGSWLHLDAPQLETWAGYLADYATVGGNSPLTPEPNVSWNSRAAWIFDEPQPNVSWNSRSAWIVDGPKPCVSWNS